jgi:pre-mRNA processing factor 3 (PRP3)/Protein of unknown function (DUF1115)
MATTTASAAAAPSSSMVTSTDHDEMAPRSSSETAAPPPPSAAAEAARAKVLALQQSIQARLAAAKRQLSTVVKEEEEPPRKRPKKEPTTTAPPVLPKATNNPYLAHWNQEDDIAPSSINTAAVSHDARLLVTQATRPKKSSLQFVTPGTYIQLAAVKREKASSVAAAGFVSGRKQGHTIYAAKLGAAAAAATSSGEEQGEAEHVESYIPRFSFAIPLAAEWWDLPLLPPALRKQVAAAERERATTDPSEAALDCTHTYAQASLSYSKTATLIQHVVPVVRNANVAAATKSSLTMFLTKKERKRQRKLRRQAAQREMQDLQAAGLVAAPQPRLTLTNFIRVLGDQAFADPSQMEQKVLEQMRARLTAHQERNQANKLTKEQRAEKRRARLAAEQPVGQVMVALFFVQDMSHPYHRSKVEANAQQYGLSGAVLECPPLRTSCVIVEGGAKPVQRYVRLMTVRMNWTGEGLDARPEYHLAENSNADPAVETEDPVVHEFNPENRCALVWQGLVVKRSFRGFTFQACETTEEARQILSARGVAQYWDQVMAHDSGPISVKLHDTRLFDNPYTARDSESSDEESDEADVTMEND